ncbi:MAG: hypothetical protein P9L91_02405 [Candidatus Zophobacter franzmannii]|jgi:hypothetical protein|nr:hypothetical protein [Candidatus Zophobacter franzmannii]
MDDRNFKYRNRRFRTSKGTSRSLVGGIASAISAFFTVSVINDLRRENGLISRTIKKLIQAKNKPIKKKVIKADYKVYDVKNEEKK